VQNFIQKRNNNNNKLVIAKQVGFVKENLFLIRRETGYHSLTFANTYSKG